MWHSQDVPLRSEHMRQQNTCYETSRFLYHGTNCVEICRIYIVGNGIGEPDVKSTLVCVGVEYATQLG